MKKNFKGLIDMIKMPFGKLYRLYSSYSFNVKRAELILSAKTGSTLRNKPQFSGDRYLTG